MPHARPSGIGRIQMPEQKQIKGLYVETPLSWRWSWRRKKTPSASILLIKPFSLLPLTCSALSNSRHITVELGFLGDCYILDSIFRLARVPSSRIPMPPSREIGVPELAHRLGCSIPLVQALIRTGRIRGRKTSRGWVTTMEAAEEYFSRHPRPAPPQTNEDVA